MEFIGIIPSRYDSSRFPGKPLAIINGKPMVQWVFERVNRVLDSVFVATDDTRIESAVKKFGGNVIMTSPAHRSGTDRCAEAMEKIRQKTGTDFDVVINIQGDEPFIQPEQIKTLMTCFQNKETQIATLVKPISNEQDIFDPNKVKVVINCKQQAIYFSRSPIPYLRTADKNQWFQSYPFYKHLGIYAYRYKVLQKITLLSQGNLELAESLEQLRWIENGYSIQTAVTHFESLGIDTPEDLERIKNTQQL